MKTLILILLLASVTRAQTPVGIYPQGSGFIFDSLGSNPSYQKGGRAVIFTKGVGNVSVKYADGSVHNLDSVGGGGFTGWKVSGGTLRTDTLIVASKDAFTHFTRSGDTLYCAIDTVKLIKPQMGVYRAWIGLNGSSQVVSQTVLENTTTLVPNWTKISTGTFKAQLGGTFNPIFTYGFATEHYGFATNGGVELVANVGFSGSGGPNSFDCILTLENTTTGVPVDPGQITFPVEFFYVIH